MTPAPQVVEVLIVFLVAHGVTVLSWGIVTTFVERLRPDKAEETLIPILIGVGLLCLAAAVVLVRTS